MKRNDLFLGAIVKAVVVIIFTFSIHLFFAGHHNPGGGFIGGLSLAAGIVLLFITFDIETIQKNIPIDYKKMTAIGVIIAVLTGLGSLVFNYPFLSHTYDYFDLFLFGETELATAVIFDIGVALAVIGTAVTIILSISEAD
ncbi:Na(+)/H(+) antiporter subunit B [Sutcliffiella cohnii]|uniref:Na(+)/H(+) antiporter subunit B n=1 Tax=Sutcliffiella cohnii TaxID=33932 RepID=A0A223KSY5_9BACI|nr:Na(+)/H(+) antiporter subunit B [Sutcliffiella cohnii]AST92579.1 Na(+)/H(+) antiporter subunit B [Sutcliffiella cohnii]